MGEFINLAIHFFILFTASENNDENASLVQLSKSLTVKFVRPPNTPFVGDSLDKTARDSHRITTTNRKDFITKSERNVMYIYFHTN